MQKIIIILIVPLFLTSTACKLRKSSGTAQQPENTEVVEEIAVEMEEREPVHESLIINFISRGEGIDHAAKSELDRILEQYSASYPDFFTAQTNRWGREGEIEYCIYFVLEDPSLQTQFIEEVEATLGNIPRVFVVRNGNCRSR